MSVKFARNLSVSFRVDLIHSGRFIYFFLFVSRFLAHATGTTSSRIYLEQYCGNVWKLQWCSTIIDFFKKFTLRQILGCTPLSCQLLSGTHRYLQRICARRRRSMKLLPASPPSNEIESSTSIATTWPSGPSSVLAGTAAAPSTRERWLLGAKRRWRKKARHKEMGVGRDSD